jgi:hypothetical protein
MTMAAGLVSLWNSQLFRAQTAMEKSLLLVTDVDVGRIGERVLVRTMQQYAVALQAL